MRDESGGRTQHSHYGLDIPVYGYFILVTAAAVFAVYTSPAGTGWFIGAVFIWLGLFGKFMFDTFRD